MNRPIKISVQNLSKPDRKCLAGILFTLFFGSLLHFVFDWSGRNPLVSLIAPVNESVWEHLKLLFFPVFFFTLWEASCPSSNPKALLPSRFIGLTAGLIFIPLSFYAYTGLLDGHFLWIDLLLFFLSVLLTFLLSRFLEQKILQKHAFPETGFLTNPSLYLSLFLFLAVLFVLFTFYPPAHPLFQDPAPARCIG